MKICINTVIWGDEYVDTYFRHSIPSLLSKDNLPLSLVKNNFKLQIMSTESDFQRIKSNLTYSHLKNLIDVEEFLIPEIEMSSKEDTFKYDRVSHCQNLAIKKSIEDNTDAILFVYPDFIFSEGVLKRLHDLLSEGYDAIFSPIPLISHDKVNAGLFRKSGFENLKPEGYSISLPPRELVRLNIDSPHPVNNGFLFNGNQYGEWPGCYYWNIPNEGQLIRSFHLHPIAISLKPKHGNIELHQLTEPFKVSLDDEFVSKTYQPTDNLYFVQDSDEFAICSLRYEADPPHTSPGSRSDLQRTNLWAEEFSSLIMRYFVTIDFFWHFDGIKSKDWGEAKVQAEEFFKIIHYHLNLPDNFLEYEDPLIYAARQRMVKRGY